MIEADAAACDAYVRAKLRVSGLAAAVVLPIDVAILVVEYRAMIVCIVLLVFALVPLSFALSLRRQVGRGGAVAFACDDHGARLTLRRAATGPAGYRTAPESDVTTFPIAHLIAAVVHADALVLVQQLAPNRVRRLIVPGTKHDVQAAAAELRQRGVAVSEEPGMDKLAGVVAGVVLAKVAAVVAFACVAGGIASIGLAATGKGGSYLKGAALLGAALAALTVVALIRLLTRPR